MAEVIAVNLVRKVDRRSLRYILYQLSKLGSIPPDVVSEAMDSEKVFRTTLTLSEADKRIIGNKSGKTISLLINSYMLMDDQYTGKVI